MDKDSIKDWLEKNVEPKALYSTEEKESLIWKAFSAHLNSLVKKKSSLINITATSFG